MRVSGAHATHTPFRTMSESSCCYLAALSTRPVALRAGIRNCGPSAPAYLTVRETQMRVIGLDVHRSIIFRTFRMAASSRMMKKQSDERRRWY